MNVPTGFPPPDPFIRQNQQRPGAPTALPLVPEADPQQPSADASLLEWRKHVASLCAALDKSHAPPLKAFLRQRLESAAKGLLNLALADIRDLPTLEAATMLAEMFEAHPVGTHVDAAVIAIGKQIARTDASLAAKLAGNAMAKLAQTFHRTAHTCESSGKVYDVLASAVVERLSGMAYDATGAISTADACVLRRAFDPPRTQVQANALKQLENRLHACLLPIEARQDLQIAVSASPSGMGNAPSEAAPSVRAPTAIIHAVNHDAPGTSDSLMTWHRYVKDLCVALDQCADTAQKKELLQKLETAAHRFSERSISNLRNYKELAVVIELIKLFASKHELAHVESGLFVASMLFGSADVSLVRACNANALRNMPQVIDGRSLAQLAQAFTLVPSWSGQLRFAFSRLADATSTCLQMEEFGRTEKISVADLSILHKALDPSRSEPEREAIKRLGRLSARSIERILAGHGKDLNQSILERLRAVSHGDESDHTNTVQLTSLIRNKGTESLSALPFDTLVQLVHFFSKQENQAHGLTTLPHIAQGIVLTENPSEALKTRTLSDLAVMASKFSMLSRHESCDAVMNLVAKEISRRLDHGAIPKGFTVQVLNTFAAAFTRSDSTTCRNASRFIASTVLQYLADDRTRSHLELSSLAGLASSFMHNANRESQCAQALDTILSLAQGLLEREDELVTVDVLMQLRDLCKSMRKHPMALALQDTINTRLQVREPISASGKRVRAADEPVEESDRKKRRTASPENPMNAGRKR